MSFNVVDDELISPCMCKGTQQFVHRACLDHWRSVKVKCYSSLWFLMIQFWNIKIGTLLFSISFDDDLIVHIRPSTHFCFFSFQEGFAFSHCTTCKAQFHLRVELFEDNSWRKIKFRLFVARDVFFVFLAVQTVSNLTFFCIFQCA